MIDTILRFFSIDFQTKPEENVGMILTSGAEAGNLLPQNSKQNKY